MHQIIILMHPPQSNELLVLFVKKKKEKKNRFRSSWLKTTCIYVKLQNVSQVHIHESSSQNLDFHFLPIYDQIMRVRKKIDQELHLKINVLKIKRYIWCNIFHQSEKKKPFRKCRGMEFHNCACKDRFYLYQIIQVTMKN